MYISTGTEQGKLVILVVKKNGKKKKKKKKKKNLQITSIQLD